jgi:hypothetical protein
MPVCLLPSPASPQCRRWEGNSIFVVASDSSDSGMWRLGSDHLFPPVISFDFCTVSVAEPELFMALVMSDLGIKSCACRVMTDEVCLS